MHPLLLKSKIIHALSHFLLSMIVSKAITIPQKDPNVLIILRILTLILLSNRSKHGLLVDTTGHETALLSQEPCMLRDILYEI